MYYLTCPYCNVQLIHLPDDSNVCPNCDWGDDPITEEERLRDMEADYQLYILENQSYEG